MEANDGGSSNGDDDDVAMPDTPDAARTTPGGSGNTGGDGSDGDKGSVAVCLETPDAVPATPSPTKKKRRRSPCSRRSGKKNRMTDNQRAMHNRRDADGDDGGTSSGHVGFGQ